METLPRISIVTPSFNDEKYLEKTISSLLDQNYPNLEYLIMDGGSTDGSLRIIEKYSRYISFWQSKEDKGMYDALSQGFSRSTGDIMGWINSDDVHQPGSLFTIAQIFSDFRHIKWIQGTPTVVDEKGRMFTDPHRFEVDKFFFYRRKHASTLKFIQQESTFWRRSLWLDAGGYISTSYKYAGDFDLWMRFFQHAPLYNINAILGSFRQTTGGQASMDHMKEYLEETFRILDQYHLPPAEEKMLKSVIFREKWSQRVEHLQRRLFPKSLSQTVVRDYVYFSPTEQKLKKK